MVNIGKNSNKIAYGIKHFNLDEEKDLSKLNKNVLTPGSSVFIIATSKYYMLNGQKKWIQINPYGSTIVSNDGNNNTPDDDDELNDDIIYDGGDI